MNGITSLRTYRIGMATFFVFAAMTTGNALAESVVLGPVKDNTLIERDAGSTSNGAGPHFFAGRIAIPPGETLRAVLAFDVAANVPAGATITGAALTLHMSKTIVGAQEVGLYRMSGDWGEGTSSYFGGSGAPATPGDTTWLHTFYDDQFWTMAGGDFMALSSAVIEVDGPGFYTWESTPEMAADVQAWLDDPAGNFGWILLGNEDRFPTVKRFDSREYEDETRRPQLAIEYELDIPCDPHPVGQGHWHRQCLGVPVSEGGIDPGNAGNGPSRPTEPGFADQLMPCADELLFELGFDSVTTCAGMDADPPSDRCERAMKKLTSLVLNVCSGRLQTSCQVDARGCSSTNLGELLEELATQIQTGNCRQADRCDTASIERAGASRLGIVLPSRGANNGGRFRSTPPSTTPPRGTTSPLHVVRDE